MTVKAARLTAIYVKAKEIVNRADEENRKLDSDEDAQVDALCREFDRIADAYEAEERERERVLDALSHLKV